MFLGVASATSITPEPERPEYYKKWRDDPKVRSLLVAVSVLCSYRVISVQ